MARARILIVDDEANARSALAELLRDDGYVVDTAADGFKALPKLEDFRPDVVLTDLKMPGMTGLELLARTRARDPHVVVLVATAYGDVDSAVTAMREGAADFLTKPVDVARLGLVLQRELERQALRRDAEGAKARGKDSHRLQQLVGSSPASRRVVDAILRVAATQAPVLVTGEAGSGKELVATAIHEHGPRARGPLVKLHCAGLAESLLETELFGHDRGGLPGVHHRRDGRIEQAHHGTLYLDEIGGLSPALQARLLRFLQERTFERVGGGAPVRVDVRIVASTAQDLQEAIRGGRFREDLHYKLAVVPIEIPPLRERAADIPQLAARALAVFAERNARPIGGFTDEALALLCRYAWPGNVRELENVIERAVVVCPVERVRVEDLATELRAVAAPPASTEPVIPGATLAEIERYAILRTLEEVGGSTSRAAEMLGISPRKIQYKLHEYSTPPPRRG
jgi:DNA-binding NtrC family response regulator